MFSFHKPKVYRSTAGCCICKAKSSSSRFTDSKKYETDFIQCFQLETPRKGEICNACVLLVKRFKRLPAGSNRHWGHVVDARVGPGLKSMTKFKKRKEEQESGCSSTTNGGASGSSKKSSNIGSSVPERFCKIFKKTKKKEKKTFDSKKETSSLGGSSDEASTPPSPSESHSDDYDNVNDMIFGKKVFKFKNQQTVHNKNYGPMGGPANQRPGYVNKKYRRKNSRPFKNRKPLSMNMFDDIADDPMWVKMKTCCGMVYECVLYEAVIVDVKTYSPCIQHAKSVKSPETVDEAKNLPILNKISKVSDLISANPSNNSSVAMKKSHLFLKRQQEQQLQQQQQQNLVASKRVPSEVTNKNELCDIPVTINIVDNGNIKTDSSYSPAVSQDSLSSLGEHSQSSLSTNENKHILVNKAVDKLHKLNVDSIKIVKTPLAVGNPLANNIKNIINYNANEKGATFKSKLGQGLANIMKCTAGNENSSDSGYEEIAQEMRKVNNVPPQNLVYATALVGLSQAAVVSAIPTQQNSYTENNKNYATSSGIKNDPPSQSNITASEIDVQQTSTSSSIYPGTNGNSNNLLLVKPKFIQQKQTAN